jgi:phage protein U
MTKLQYWGLLGRSGDRASIQFQLLNTPIDFSLSQSNQFVEQSRILGKPTLQQVGGSLSTLSFSMEFQSGWCNPQAEIDKLTALSALKKPQPLTIGNRSYGNWVIEGIKEEILSTDTDGFMFYAKAEVSLKEWVGTLTPDRQSLKNASFRKVVR